MKKVLIVIPLIALVAAIAAAVFFKFGTSLSAIQSAPHEQPSIRAAGKLPSTGYGAATNTSTTSANRTVTGAAVPTGISTGGSDDTQSLDNDVRSLENQF